MNFDWVVSFELISTLVLFSIFTAFTYLLPKEHFSEHYPSIRMVRGYVILSATSLIAYSLRLYNENWYEFSLLTYNFFAVLGIYALILSILKRNSSNLSNRQKLLFLIHFISYMAVVFYSLSQQLEPLLLRVLLALNLSAGLFITSWLITKQNRYKARGEKIFAKSIFSSAVIIALSLGIIFWGNLNNPVVNYFIVNLFFVAGCAFVLFGFAISLVYAFVRQLKKNINTDRLTGVYNRNYFYDVVAKMLAFSERQGQPSSLVICDIDDFKKINDTFGHITGDLVLVSFAKLLKSQLRLQDVIIRLGGEEFLIFLPGKNIKQSAIVAERLRRESGLQMIELGEQSISYTVSFGITEIDHNKSVDKNISDADLALYRAKKQGKNKVLQHRDEGCVA